MAGADHGEQDPDLYQLLGVPRRAAYDRALGSEAFGPGAAVPAVKARPPHPAGPGVRPTARAPGPPLRAGPVRVEGPHRAQAAGGWDEQEARLAVLALWYLAGQARGRGRPW
jgi:hypothetical protein